MEQYGLYDGSEDEDSVYDKISPHQFLHPLVIHLIEF